MTLSNPFIALIFKVLKIFKLLFEDSKNLHITVLFIDKTNDADIVNQIKKKLPHAVKLHRYITICRQNI